MPPEVANQVVPSQVYILPTSVSKIITPTSPAPRAVPNAVLAAVSILLSCKPFVVDPKSKEALAFGDPVSIPMEPEALISILLVGAPGLILNGNRLPLVTSRMKKFVSLPAISQVWGVKPLVPSCSKRIVDVSPSGICNSTAGVAVPIPTLPASSTYNAFDGAPASTLKICLPAVASSTEK